MLILNSRFQRWFMISNNLSYGCLMNSKLYVRGKFTIINIFPLLKLFFYIYSQHFQVKNHTFCHMTF